jgi:transcriptional regulator with XRE-family HTH domain
MKKNYKDRRVENVRYRNLRRARMELNVSMETLANECGVSRQWIHRIESFTGTPSKPLLDKLEVFFGRNADWLMAEYNYRPVFGNQDTFCPYCGQYHQIITKHEGV